jgi:hypothetical protein
LQLREDTGKYLQFLRENNEKPTRKFCRLGKDTNTVDDIRQIQRPGGGEFRTDEERAEHVRTFYVNLFFFSYADLRSTIAFIETNDLLDFNNQNRNLNMIRYRITVLCVGDSFGTKCKDDLTDWLLAEAQGKELYLGFEHKIVF